MTRLLCLIVLALAVPDAARAQNADDYRGGWRTGDDDPHTYEFSIRGTQVRGIYCTRCSDATTLAFVDGTLGADGLTFTVTHVRPDGSTASQDRATARISGRNLVVSGTMGQGGAAFTRTMYKDSRGPDPLPIPVIWTPGPGMPPQTLTGGRFGGAGGAPPAAAPAAGAPAATTPTAPGAGRAAGAGAPAAPAGGGRGYLQPAPWKSPLTASDVVGVWLGFGNGVNKQFFIIRRVGNRLRGMVCGRCDNPYTMAALDDFELKGDTLTFKILHEDWGDYTMTFEKRVIARVAANEMRFTTEQDNIPAALRRPAGAGGGGSSLMGPIAIEATAGNDSRPGRLTAQ